MALIYRIGRRLVWRVKHAMSQCATRVILWGNDVDFKEFHTKGIPYVSVARTGKCTIGSHFRMNNSISGNPIGPNRKCIIFVDSQAEMNIGHHVGISQCALISTCYLEVQDYVKIGGGTCVYTSDFHSLHPEIRKSNDDFAQRADAPVIIKENAFIGTNCMILKGVTIGKNSIIGAGSVVTHSVPDNEVWAGNPARFIKKVPDGNQI